MRITAMPHAGRLAAECVWLLSVCVADIMGPHVQPVIGGTSWWGFVCVCVCVCSCWLLIRVLWCVEVCSGVWRWRGGSKGRDEGVVVWAWGGG